MMAVLARLKWRASAPTSSAAGWLPTFVLAGIAAAMALMGYACTLRYGLTFILAWFLILHVGWLSAAAAIGSTGGLDPDVLLRFPIKPRTLFSFNVLATLFDRVGVLMLASLAGMVVAAFGRSGPAFGFLLSLAAIPLAVTTACIIHIAAAVAARFIGKRWQRTLALILVGASSTGLILVSGQRLAGNLSLAGSPERFLIEVWAALARLSVLVPSTALSAGAVSAAAGAHLWAGLSFLAGAMAVTAVLLMVGGALIGPSVAKQGYAGTSALRLRTSGRRFDRPTPIVITLLRREVRYFLRDPFLLARALFMVLFMAALVVFERGTLGPAGVYVIANAPLAATVNVAVNHYGLDHHGLALLFLAPIPERSIVLAKNLASVCIGLATAALGMVPGILLGQVSFWRLAQLFMVLVITYPYVLAVSNWLSIKNPRRMAFRIGGIPLSSTFGSLSVALLMILVAAAQWSLSTSAIGPIAGHLLVGLVGVILWDLSVSKEERYLIAGREKLLTALKPA